MNRIRFRELGRGDFPTLAGWLSQPHVARWWNHEVTPEAIERDFGASVDGTEPCRRFVVCVDDVAIGLIQRERYADYPDDIAALAPILDVPEGAISIDYLIGEPAYVGRGFGAAMIAEFVERSWRDDATATCVIVPVSSANLASIAALRSAGFRVVATGELEPDNPIDDRFHDVLRRDRP